MNKEKFKALKKRAAKDLITEDDVKTLVESVDLLMFSLEEEWRRSHYSKCYAAHEDDKQCSSPDEHVREAWREYDAVASMLKR